MRLFSSTGERNVDDGDLTLLEQLSSVMSARLRCGHFEIETMPARCVVNTNTIDFDEASTRWRVNKRSRGNGAFEYVDADVPARTCELPVDACMCFKCIAYRVLRADSNSH